MKDLYKEEYEWFCALSFVQKIIALSILATWGIAFMSLCSDSPLFALLACASSYVITKFGAKFLPKFPLKEE